jgi:hypothetical protein
MAQGARLVADGACRGRGARDLADRAARVKITTFKCLEWELSMTEKEPDGGRRKTDRRKAQQPFEGEDRRKGERRSGQDRRSAPRPATEE